MQEELNKGNIVVVASDEGDPSIRMGLSVARAVHEGLIVGGERGPLMNSYQAKLF